MVSGQLRQPAQTIRMCIGALLAVGLPVVRLRSTKSRATVAAEIHSYGSMRTVIITPEIGMPFIRRRQLTQTSTGIPLTTLPMEDRVVRMVNRTHFITSGTRPTKFRSGETSKTRMALLPNVFSGKLSIQIMFRNRIRAGRQEQQPPRRYFRRKPGGIPGAAGPVQAPAISIQPATNPLGRE